MSEQIKEGASSQPRKSSETSQDIIYNFTTHVLDKRYELYYWIDNKINLLLLINTVMAGLCYFLVDKSEKFAIPLIPKLLILSALVFLFISIIQCLILIIPKMRSPIWKSKQKKKLIVKQIRTSMGIEEFTPDEYKRTLKALDFDTIIEMNADQIKKMNKIIMTDSTGVKRGVILTVIAAFLIFICVILALIYTQQETALVQKTVLSIL